MLQARANDNQRVLSCLTPGEVGVVRAVRGPVAHIRRIMALGFNPGAQVRMIRRAPLGDPLEFEVCGCLLSLRASEADKILMEDSNLTQDSSLMEDMIDG